MNIGVARYQIVGWSLGQMSARTVLEVGARWAPQLLNRRHDRRVGTDMPDDKNSASARGSGAFAKILSSAVLLHTRQDAGPGSVEFSATGADHLPLVFEFSTR